MVPPSHEDHLHQHEHQYNAPAMMPMSKTMDGSRGVGHYVGGHQAGDYKSARLQEIEILKKQLEQMEGDYQKLQAEVTKEHSFSQAYKDAENERELQIVYYKQQGETLSKQLEILSKRVADYNAKEKELNELKLSMASGGSAGDAEKKDSKLRTALESLSSQVDAYIEEIDELNESFDDIQAHNSKLLQQLTEQSECQVKLRAQMLRQEKDVANIRKEMVTQESRIRDEKALYNTKETELREVEKKYNMMELKWQQTTRSLQEKEKVQRELEAVESKLKQKISELENELDVQKETSANEKKRKLEGDTSVHGGSEDKAKKSVGKKDIREVQMKHYQKLLFCSICNTREKKMIIKRCLHMFCKECISTSVQSRNRKCPACGAKFAQSDLQPIYF